MRTLVASALMTLAALAWAQDAAPAAGATGPASFAVQIDAPAEVAALLERHLELQRYRQLSDLSDAEIQSLLLSAQQDATELLATLGYFSPDIRITLQPPRDPATVTRLVQIVVQPGPPTRVAAMRMHIEGAIAAPDADARAQAQRREVQDLWTLAVGEPFSQAAWDNAKQHALKALLARRYPTARLVDSRADVNPDAASAELEVTLDSGPAYRIGSLEVEGNQRYSADLVRRFARLRPGQDYELERLVEAQRRMTDSGYYDSAYLSLDTASDPGQAVVRAQVKESTMQKMVFGLGASTDTGARWSVEETYNEVPGIHWRTVNKLTASRDSKSFNSDWTSQPDDSAWRWAASALFEQNKVDEIDVISQRYRAGRLTTDTALDQNYYLQFDRTEAIYRELDQSITNEAVSANYAFTLRRFDSTPFPSSGWGLGGEIGVGTVLGARQEPFSRVLLRALAYQPLGQSLENLFERQHAGRLVYRAQVGGVVVDDATAIPFNQLFLTGGDTTVRGYRYQEIGVTHNGILSTDSGRYLATAGIEWQRPIVRKGLMTDWESAVFIDTGAVANRIEEFSFKSGVGVGARWKSPIGPLQIDLAYGIATQALRLHLNVGFVF